MDEEITYRKEDVLGKEFDSHTYDIAPVKYLRNKIRHELLPLLAEMNPSIQETVKHEMRILEGVAQVYVAKVEEVRKDLTQEKNGIVHFEISALLALNPLHNYLYELLSPYGFYTVKAISKALQRQSGKQFFSSTHQLVVDRKKIFISLLNKENEVFEITEKTINLVNPLDIKFKTTADKTIIYDNNIAQLDFEKLKFPLILRKWKGGDKFMPLGMIKFKKLSDFFIDNKFSIIDKQEQWLLCSDLDIVWVVGCRIDERYKLKTNTKKVYIAKL